MRILIISAYFYPHQGGSERYMEELYAHLVARVSSMTVDVICYNTQRKRQVEYHRGLTIYRIPCIEILQDQFAIPNYIALARLLYRLTKSQSYDIIHSNTRFFEHSWWVPLVAKRVGTICLLSDHCSYHPIHASTAITRIARVIDEFFLSFLGPRYDHIVVSNEATRQYHLSYGARELSLVYAGADIKTCSPKKRSGNLTVTFLGRFVTSKYPQLFVQSMGDILKRHPGLRCVMAGDGPLLPLLKKQAGAGRIRFPGILDTAGCARLLGTTDIFVHLTIHRDGFPSVILDAGACGCAVISTGAPEIITHNVTGLVIEPTRRHLFGALEDLVSHPQKRLRLGNRLRRNVCRTFTWEKSARALAHVLHTCL